MELVYARRRARGSTCALSVPGQLRQAAWAARLYTRTLYRMPDHNAPHGRSASPPASAHPQGWQANHQGSLSKTSVDIPGIYDFLHISEANTDAGKQRPVRARAGAACIETNTGVHRSRDEKGRQRLRPAGATPRREGSDAVKKSSTAWGTCTKLAMKSWQSLARR